MPAQHVGLSSYSVAGLVSTENIVRVDSVESQPTGRIDQNGFSAETIWRYRKKKRAGLAVIAAAAGSRFKRR
jgi:hypothetical protein